MSSFSFVQATPISTDAFRRASVNLYASRSRAITTRSFPRYCSTNQPFPGNFTSRTIKATALQPHQKPDVDINNTIKTPVHPRIPFIGTVIDNFILNLRGPDFAARYGDVYYTDMFGDKVYVITDLEAIINILRNPKTFCNSVAFLKPIRQLFGPGALLLSDGVPHARARAKILAVFTPQLYPTYFETVLSSSRFLWDSIGTATEVQHPWNRKKGVSMGKFIREHFLRVVVNISTFSSSMISHSDIEKVDEGEILQLCSSMIEGMLNVPFGPTWENAWRSRRKLVSLVQRIMRDRLVNDADTINQIRQGEERFEKLLSTRRADILNVLLAGSTLPTGNPDVFCEDALTLEIKEELTRMTTSLIELWIAGYFSQGSATLSCLMEISMNNDIKAALMKEQEQVEELNFETVTNHMPLLLSFILEVLRLHPPTFDWYRRTTSPTNIKGHEIPADHLVLLDFWASQRSQKYFRNAETLDIRRFLEGHRDEKEREKELSRFISFGVLGGPHYCAGAKFAKIALMTTLAIMLREYDLDVQSRTSKLYDNMPYFQPKNGVRALSCKRK